MSCPHCPHCAAESSKSAFQEGLDKLVHESHLAKTPEEHLAVLRKLQALFEQHHHEAYKLGVDTSASYRDNEANQILERAESGGINTYTAVNPYEWLPSSWGQC